MTENLNDSLADFAIINNYQVHYKNSPINSLIYKIIKEEYINNSIVKSNKEELKNSKKIISLMSSMGGTGKTTLALNLACEYAKKDKKTLVIDFSTFSNIAISLKMKNKLEGLDNIISELNRTIEKGEEIDTKMLLKQNMLTYKANKVSFDIIYSDAPLKIEKINSKVIGKIFEGIKLLDHDVIIIDTSSELTERNLAIAELVDDIILCAIPDISCGWKLIKMKEIFDHIHVSSKCKMVINKYSKKSLFSCKELEKELQYKLIGVIPFSKPIQYYANVGTVIGTKNEKVNQYVRYMAHNILPIFEKKKLNYVKYVCRR